MGDSSLVMRRVHTRSFSSNLPNQLIFRQTFLLYLQYLITQNNKFRILTAQRGHGSQPQPRMRIRGKGRCRFTRARVDAMGCAGPEAVPQARMGDGWRELR
jgi:hypothetical protein